jgi:hypothetical protein
MPERDVPLGAHSIKPPLTLKDHAMCRQDLSSGTLADLSDCHLLASLSSGVR